MDKLRELAIYAEEFRAEATQLNTLRLAREWTEAGVPAAQAAAWASLGYQPTEAAPLIEQGITPDAAAAMEEAEVAVDGGPEIHRMEVVDRLVHDGVLVDPTRITQHEDPDDPSHIIVTVWPDEPA